MRLHVLLYITLQCTKLKKHENYIFCSSEKILSLKKSGYTEAKQVHAEHHNYEAHNPIKMPMCLCKSVIQVT